jgi:hypothetical protein
VPVNAGSLLTIRQLKAPFTRSIERAARHRLWEEKHE